MKTAIIGDSFTYTYKDTWIEEIVNQCDLTLSSSVGFSGMSQYTLYKNFLQVINEKPDIILICHTEHSRLYHSKEIIHKWFFNEEDKPNLVKNKEILEASRQYYLHLYDEDFSRFTYACMVEKMQKICKQNNIKLINIPCFEHEFIDKNYGLWILSDSGLINCSRADHRREYERDWIDISDPRTNHFSPIGHQVLANNIIPHIKTYITTDQEFHAVLLFPELFA
jgi:hypothetical protein